jgi:hypothetical protein
MPLSETIIGSVTKSVADGLSRLLVDGESDKLKLDYSKARECLIDHLAMVDRWSSSISMLHLQRDKKLLDAFVELSFDVGWLRFVDEGCREKLDTLTDRAVVSSSDLLDADGHVAILGRPGAGKTTSLQRIAQLTLRRWEEGGIRVPILVLLRDLRDGEAIIQHLLVRLGITVRIHPSASAHVRRLWEQRALLRYLDQVSALLLIDGLDEVDPAIRPLIETELREIALANGRHRIFLTCRVAEYHAAITHIQPYTIRALTPETVLRFTTQWLGTQRGKAFVSEIKYHPYVGTEMIPLTLGHLCAVYERNGSLPRRPIDVYDAIVSLLLEEWDRQRGVRRVSKYGDFTARKKERFLQAVAFELTMMGRRGAFGHDDLCRVYQRVGPSFGLPLEDEEPVILEVESHTGLVHQIDRRRYQFVHLVLQEFLCALYVLRSTDNLHHLIPKFPNEAALLVAYSTDLDVYLEEIFQLIEMHEVAGCRFVTIFFVRLGIEEVDVPPSARTGWILLSYLSWYSNNANDPWPTVSNDSMETRWYLQCFFSRSGVANSIQMAIDQSTVEFDRFGSARIWPQVDDDLTPFVRGRTNGLFLRASRNVLQYVRALQR